MDENVVDATVEEVVTPQNEQAEVAEVETEVVENAESEVVTDTPEEVEKPVQTPEENAKFADIRRKYEAEVVVAESDAQDALIAKMYGDSHGIKTVKEYDTAMAKQKEKEEVAKIQEDKNYSEEDAREILDARRIKQENEQSKQAQSEQQQLETQTRNNNIEFLDYFKVRYDRDYDNVKDVINPEVWKAVNNGTPLKYAYMEHEIKELKLGTKVAEKNAVNATATIGSVKGDGVVDSPLTEQQIANMSTSELMSRWAEVKKVTGMV